MKDLRIKAEDLKKSELFLTYNILVGREIKPKKREIFFLKILVFIFAVFIIYDAGFYKSEIIFKFSLFFLFLSFLGIAYRSLQILIIEDRTFSAKEIMEAFKKINKDRILLKKKLINLSSLIKEQEVENPNTKDYYIMENPELLFLEEDSGAFINICFSTSPELENKIYVLEKIRKIQNHFIYSIPFERLGLNLLFKEKEGYLKSMMNAG